MCVCVHEDDEKLLGILAITVIVVDHEVMKAGPILSGISAKAKTKRIAIEPHWSFC